MNELKQALDEITALSAATKADAGFVLTTEITHKIATWLLSGDTGTSSETIASAALGVKRARDYHWPRDSGDFGRCYRLLTRIPQLRAALPLVVGICPGWAPLLAVWDELTDLYKQGRTSAGRLECHKRVRDLQDACMIADGWKKVSDGYWTKDDTAAATA